MYADTGRIRALADDLRERAGEIRALAARLVARADGVAWQGLAADAMRAHARGRADALRRCALLHDDAAEALDRHAGRVAWLESQIDAVGDAIEDKVRGLVDILPGIG